MPRPPDEIDDDTLRVLTASGIGPATLRSLRQTLGDDAAVVAATPAELGDVPRVGPAAGRVICAAIEAADPASERAAMVAAGASLILLGDADYPPLLAATPQAPEAIWIRGALDGNCTDAEGRSASSSASSYTVAIVGARRATAYGREQAGRFASMLVDAGFVIVSGGARGIDAAAHRGALCAGGRTVAVLGCGVGHCYPREHVELFREIAADGHGAVVSEFPTMFPPRTGNFPRRNRIVAGMSLGVIVVEAGARSVGPITARIAVEDHGREVMAVPGRVDARGSAGCHALIQTGGAALVTSPLDVLRQLEIVSEHSRQTLGAESASEPMSERGLSDRQRRLLQTLPRQGAVPRPAETIAAAVGTDVAVVLADLTVLEVRGLVARGAEGVVRR